MATDTLEPWGHDLHRPECVIATADGDVYVPDWRGGVTLIRADGSQHTFMGPDPGLRPNGIALAPDGSFLIANLGEAGGIWRLGRDTTLVPVITEVEGMPVPPANFVTVDAHGRTWASVSTRHHPRQLAWRQDVADGFIVLADARGARIVADGIHYTNEVRPDPSGEWLYVVETLGRRLTRFRIAADGTLRDRETVVTLGYGCFPDGFAFDDEGGIWITSLVSNRVLRWHEDRIETIVEDANSAFIDEVEMAFRERRMETRHLGPIPGTRLQQATSIAFGGPDRRDGWIGQLHSSCIYRFRSVVSVANAIDAA
jgi:sugar lactone lactonase YvrE